MLSVGCIRIVHLQTPAWGRQRGLEGWVFQGDLLVAQRVRRNRGGSALSPETRIRAPKSSPRSSPHSQLCVPAPTSDFPDPAWGQPLP